MTSALLKKGINYIDTDGHRAPHLDGPARIHFNRRCKQHEPRIGGEAQVFERANYMNVLSSYASASIRQWTSRA